MKKEILVNCVITVNKNGCDKFYDADMLSDFKTASEIYDYFYDLIKEGEIESFYVLDSFPVIVGGSYNWGNVIRSDMGAFLDENYKPFPVKFVE